MPDPVERQALPDQSATPDLGTYLYFCTDHGWRRPSFARDCPKCGAEMERIQVAPVAERDRLRAENEALTAESLRYRAAIRQAMDTMAVATDHQLGPGGVARKAYADLYVAYYSNTWVAGISGASDEEDQHHG